MVTARSHLLHRFVFRGLASGLALVLIPLGGADGQSVTLATDVLELSGRLPIASGGLTRSLRVTVAGADSTDRLVFLPGDLTGDGRPGMPVIDRSDVSVGTFTVVNGVPFDVALTVSDPGEPGTYTGRFDFELRSEDGELRDGARGTMVVEVQPPASLDVRVPADGYQRVNCSGLGCWLARRILHPDATRDSLTLWLEHSSPSVVTITGLKPVLFGAHSRRLADLPAREVELDIPPGGTTVRYPWPAGTAGPDSYQGSLQVPMEGLEQPVGASLRVDVRGGPSLMLLLLVLGVLISRALAPIGKGPPSEGKRGNWVIFVAGLSWPEGDSARDRREWGARALTIAVLLLALLIVGTEEIYVDDPTFGDQVVFDHVKAFLWPFTADVMLRGLGNIKWPPKKEATTTTGTTHSPRPTS